MGMFLRFREAAVARGLERVQRVAFAGYREQVDMYLHTAADKGEVLGPWGAMCIHEKGISWARRAVDKEMRNHTAWYTVDQARLTGEGMGYLRDRTGWSMRALAEVGFRMQEVEDARGAGDSRLARDLTYELKRLNDEAEGAGASQIAAALEAAYQQRFPEQA